MKVLFITDDPGISTGVASVSRNIVENPPSDLHFSVVGCNVKDTSSQIPNFGVVQRFSNYGTYNWLINHVRNNDYDTCMVMGDPHLFGHVYKASPFIRSKMPLVYYHVWDSSHPAPTFNKPVYDCFDHIMCASNETFLGVQKSGRQSGFKLVPHGVNLDVYNPENASRMSENIKFFQHPRFEDQNVILFAGTNQKRKNIAQIIEVFSKCEYVDDSQLVIKTDPGGYYNVPRIASYYDVLDRVSMYSQTVDRNSMAGVYGNADVLINIPHREGFGLVPLEAAACGVPSIVSFAGGQKDQKTKLHYNILTSHSHVECDPSGTLVRETFVETNSAVPLLNHLLLNPGSVSNNVHNQIKELNMDARSMRKTIYDLLRNQAENYGGIDSFFIDTV